MPDRDLRRRVAVSLALVVGLLAAGATDARADVHTQVAPPTLPAPDNSFAAVACPTATTCVAAGELAVAGGTAAAVDEQTGAAWSFHLVALPPDASTTAPMSSLAAITCTSPHTCVAVGSYVDTKGAQEPLVAVETAGTWTSFRAPMPPDAAPSVAPGGAQPVPTNALGAVDCAAVGECAAVGSYVDLHGNVEALLVTAVAATWGAVPAPLPGDAAVSTTPPVGTPTPEPNNVLDAVDCTSPGTCVVVGDYEDASGSSRVLLDSSTTGTWSATVAPLPADAASSGVVSDGLVAVSCTSDTDCVAVGGYQDHNGSSLLLVDIESSGTWATAVLPLPADAGASSPTSAITDNLDDVTCTSTGECVAVGGYQEAGGGTLPVIETLHAGSWTARSGPVPPDADTKLFFDNLSALSCSSEGNCAAVGLYTSEDGPRNVVALMAVEIQGVWHGGTVELPGNVAVTAGYSALVDVTCTGTTTCVAVGVYVDVDGHNQVLLDVLGLSFTGAPIVPGPPTAVRAVRGHAQAIVRWKAPSSDGGSPIVQYTVTALPAGPRCTTTATTCLLRGLVGGVAYQFGVVATSAVGDSVPSLASPVYLIGGAVRLRSVVWPFGARSWTLSPALRAQIRATAVRVGSYGDTRVSVTGYTDDLDATAAQALSVSRHRAQAVAHYLSARLAALGVTGVRVTWAGRGRSDPLATNLSEAGRARNRRVEIDGA